jgi:Tol biopolymer transport system component
MTSCNSIDSPLASSSDSTNTPTSQFENDPFIFTYSTFDGQILQVNASGQKPQIVLSDGVQKEYLSWAPNRTRLAYVAAEATEAGLQRTLWVVSADGSEARPVFSPVKALRYSWDADSRTIYVEEAISFERIPFDKDTIIQAYTIDVEINAVQAIERRTELFPPPISSPNGERAIWTDPTDDKWILYLLDSDGNKLSVIYQPPLGRATSGVWSSDSQQLAIIRPEDKEIYLYQINTDEWIKLSSLSVVHREYLISNLQWSPNGKWLSYTLNDQKHTNQICVFSIAERTEQCFNTQWISNQYVWSRDSHHIAYLSKTPSEEVDIFIIDVNKGVIENLTQDGNIVNEQRITQ